VTALAAHSGLYCYAGSGPGCGSKSTAIYMFPLKMLYYVHMRCFMHDGQAQAPVVNPLQ
jgi:hypothetical protein